MRWFQTNISLPLKGGGLGWGCSGDVQARPFTPHPHPHLPPERGKEKSYVTVSNEQLPPPERAKEKRYATVSNEHFPPPEGGRARVGVQR